MIIEVRPRLSTYLTDQMASGRIVFTRDKVISELGISRRAFLDAAERLQRKGQLASPRHGFYVIVPPQFSSWGGPPPSWYIDDLMRYEGRDYYVAILKAAELHGAAHQAVMAFQVITDKRLPDIRLGRSKISFHFRKTIQEVSSGIVRRKTDTGNLNLSAPELTALDLVRYARAAGGLHNIATVLIELSNGMDVEKLASLSTVFERSVVQRLGFVLDHLGHENLTRSLNAAIRRRKLNWVELDPHEAKGTDFAADVVERNKHWRVIVRRLPEIDE